MKTTNQTGVVNCVIPLECLLRPPLRGSLEWSSSWYSASSCSSSIVSSFSSTTLWVPIHIMSFTWLNHLIREKRLENKLSPSIFRILLASNASCDWLRLTAAKQQVNKKNTYSQSFKNKQQQKIPYTFQEESFTTYL
jgi:hypothetical protein